VAWGGAARPNVPESRVEIMDYDSCRALNIKTGLDGPIKQTHVTTATCAKGRWTAKRRKAPLWGVKASRIGKRNPGFQTKPSGKLRNGPSHVPTTRNEKETSAVFCRGGKNEPEKTGKIFREASTTGQKTAGKKGFAGRENQDVEVRLKEKSESKKGAERNVCPRRK